MAAILPRTLAVAAIIFSPLVTCAQNALRYDGSVWTINQSAPVPGGLFPVIVSPGSQVAVCNAPVGGVSCVTLATTYNDQAEDMVCPTTAPLTRPNSNSCASNSDPEGGLGVWVGAGCYQWVATTSYGQSVPQDFCVGASGASGTISSFAAPSGSWPAWLVPSVTAPTGPATLLAVSASPIPNSALANPQTTVNGTPCVLGSTCTITAGGGFYQTVLNGGGIADAVTQRSYLAVGGGTGLFATDIVGVGPSVGRTVLQVNTTASNTTFDPFVVGSAGAAAPGTPAVWDSVGGLAGSTSVTQDFSVTGCTTATSTDSNCTGSIAIPISFSDASYFPQLTINSINGAFLSISVSGSLTSSAIPYTITCTFNCSAIVAPTIYVHAFHP